MDLFKKCIERHMRYFYSLPYQNNKCHFSNWKFSQRIKTRRGIAGIQEKDPLNKENCRPVSVLPHVLKLLKKCL